MNLYFAPDQDCETPLVNMINGATVSLTIADYSFSAPSITEAVINTYNRGISTTLLFDKSQSSGKAEKSELAKLDAAKVPYTIGSSDKHKIMHLKVAVADDSIAFGSYNFTNAANLENNVLAIYQSKDDSATFITQINKAIDFIHSEPTIKLGTINKMNLIEWLQGKKTYIFSVLTVLDGLWQYYVQHGLNIKALFVYLLAGGGLSALRAAISKVNS